MKRRASVPFAATLVLALGSGTLPSQAAVQTWIADDATVTFALDAALLEDLGMRVVQTRSTAQAPADRAVMEGDLHSFRAVPGVALSFRTDNGGFAGFEEGTATIPFQGGLALATWDPRTKAALSPAFLYDFALEIDPARHEIARIVTADPDVRVPLEVRSTSFRFTWTTGELALVMGDMVVTEAWARALGQPALAGQYVGAFDLLVESRPSVGEGIAPEAPRRQDPAGPGGAPYLDVTIGELYGLTSFGHEGTFPNGVNGLAASTTSCNSGHIRVPWNAPMAETHPTICAGLFRVSAAGVLEMLGHSWMKHGFLALSNDQCNLGCEGCGGNQLCIGCSDTYSSGLNAMRFYLGPREEVNPFTGTWEACGSFFDEPVVPDPDCARNYDGNETSSVAHRLVVWDEDLGNPGALYYYEGQYVVADDQDPFNSIGWRRCTMQWTGSSWAFQTVGGGLTPTYGPLIFTWGDAQHKKELADDDGQIVLATKVTDLGGGEWHYEYALYNWNSWRGMRSISIPIAGAPVSNVGFHDIDKTSGNNWAITNDGLTLTWDTDDWATDPDANAIRFGELFNFRFDAATPPTTGPIAIGIFEPGVGTTLLLNAAVPQGGATSALVGPDRTAEFELAINEPNPFAGSTEVRFSLGQSRDIRLSVFDIAGRLVQVLAEGPAPAGPTAIRWDGRDTSGRRAAPGVYFFRLESGEDVRTVKGTLLR
jgi:hypothetical protein